MLSERGGRAHQLRIVHPDLVGTGKPTARAVNQEAVSVPLLGRHLVNGNLGIASERRCAAHRRASCSWRAVARALRLDASVPSPGRERSGALHRHLGEAAVRVRVRVVAVARHYAATIVSEFTRSARLLGFQLGVVLLDEGADIGGYVEQLGQLFLVKGDGEAAEPVDGHATFLTDLD